VARALCRALTPVRTAPSSPPRQACASATRLSAIVFQADGSQNGTLRSVFRGPPNSITRAASTLAWQQPLGAGSSVRVFNTTLEWSADGLAADKERRVCLDVVQGASLARLCGAASGSGTCLVSLVTDAPDCCPVFSYRAA
jgi:hypothetical protein